MARIKTLPHITRKAAILHEAAALFREKGYAAASMRELADRLGVEAPSLYNHIGSKAELLREICFETGHYFIQQTELIEASDRSPLEKIEAIIRFHIRQMLDAFNVVYVANHDWKQLPEPHLTDFLAIRRRYEKSIIQLIEAGILANQLRPIHPQVAALVLLSAVRGLEFWQRQKGKIPIAQLENDMVQHLLHGMIQPH